MYLDQCLTIWSGQSYSNLFTVTNRMDVRTASITPEQHQEESSIQEHRKRIHEYDKIYTYNDDISMQVHFLTSLDTNHLNTGQ